MDALTIILRHVRETIEATGVPPDALQQALAEAEARTRRSLGGQAHHISRLPQVPTKARIVELASEQLTPQQISQRLGVTDRYVRKVIEQLRLAED